MPRFKHVSHASELPPAVGSLQSRLPRGKYGWLVRGLPACGKESPAQIPQASDPESKDDVHPSLPAGYTYLAQFINHDLTFDAATIGQRTTDPNQLHNFRTPALDLDHVYGRGPGAEPMFYDAVDNRRLCIGHGRDPREADLPRLFLNLELAGSVSDEQQVCAAAVIPDPRNDQNLILSQLHTAMIDFHNRVVAWCDRKRPSEFESLDSDDEFERIRQKVIWTYQFLVVHDFLRRILCEETWNRLSSLISLPRNQAVGGLAYYRPTNAPYIPIEFSGAAFRFGHSLIRDAYFLNRGTQKYDAGPIKIMGQKRPTEDGGMADRDLRGKRQLPGGWGVDWPFFFDFHDSPVKPQTAFRIDTKIAGPLLKFVEKTEPVAIAELDHQRAESLRLPSGETLALAMGLPVFGASVQGASRGETPLLRYILQESEETERGKRLGRLGSEIVGETILGLLLMDSNSYLARDHAWEPFYGGYKIDTFARLLAFDPWWDV